MEFIRCFRCMEETDAYPCTHCGYDPDAHPGQAYVLRPGTILGGKYVAGTPLGQGGFGITYIGWDLATSRKVAIKEYFPTGQVSRNVTITNDLQWYTTNQARAALEQGMVSFQKEARKMELVSGIPQVVDVLDVFEENMTAYIVMDFIAGQTLKDRLAKTGPLPWDQTKAIFLPVIEAMDKVHSKGLIHRDLSPDNLMILPDGSVKILDLGASKDLNVNTGASSMQVAKGGFSPLEQYTQRGGSGTWTDVYAMAATMYYTLTGVLPPAAVDRVANDPMRWDLPQLTVLPLNVLVALQRAMGLLQNQRTQTMAQFAKELATPFQEKTSKTPDTKTAKKPMWPVLAGAAALALVVSLITGGDLLFSRTSPKTPATSQTVSATDISEITLRNTTISGDLTTYTDTRPGNFDSDSEYTALVRSGAQDAYQYTDGSTLTMYYDDADQERCRIYTDSDGQRQMIFTAEYTDDGQFLECRTYDGTGKLQRVDLNEYDNGSLIRKRIYDGSGSLYRLRCWDYDASGRSSAYREYTGSGKALESGVYSYDNKGFQTYNYEKQNGTLSTIIRNADGYILSSASYDENGSLQSQSEYNYNSQWQRISAVTYSEGSEDPSSKTEYVYEGDLITQEITHSYYSGRDNVTTYTLLYGPNNEDFGRKSNDYSSEYVSHISGNTMYGISWYYDNRYSSCTRTTYDWMGNYLRAASYDVSGNIIDYSEYSYDQEGIFLGYTSSYTNSYDGSYTVTEYDEEYLRIKRTEYDRQGNLTYWTEFIYEESQDWEKTYDANGNLTETVLTQYNENGDTLSETTTDGDGNLVVKYEYQYDADGVKTGQTYTYVSSYDGSTHITTYDANDRETAERDYDADGNITGRTDYTYTDNQKRATSYDASGAVTSYTIYTYAANGDVAIIEYYNQDNQLSSKDEYHFDADGNPTGRTYTYHSSYDDTDTITEYDAQGNRISKNVYDAKGNRIEWTDYIYTDSSLTEKTYDASGTVTRIVETQFNENGDKLSELTYDGNGRLTDAIDYFYDEDGYRTGYSNTDYYSDGSKVVYTYDADYELVSKETFDANGNLTSKE